jgi:cyclic nucleotide-binding protein/MFS transporter
VLVAAWPHPAAALVLLAFPGVGNAFADVAGLTLLQRITPDEVLGRVFGSLEAVVFAGTALGSLVASGLIAVLGIRGALVAAGAFLPGAVVLAWPRLRRLDSESDVPERRLELLRDIPMFAPLPPVALEHLALALAPVTVPARGTVFRAGVPGELFYVIDSGEANVSIDRRTAGRLGPGGYFGEIALLENVPRTATVKAVSDLELLCLDRDRFIGAVTGHPVSTQAAAAVVDQRLHAPPTTSAGRRRSHGSA